MRLLFFTNIHMLNDWTNISDWIQNNKSLADRFDIRNYIFDIEWLELVVPRRL